MRGGENPDSDSPGVAIMNKFFFGLTLASLAAGSAAVMAQQDSEYRSKDGLLIVRSAGTSYTPSGPAPDFARLDTNGDGFIDGTEAKGYALLANDFRMADSNHDGKVSKHEYKRWAAMP
jgi:hypothetical protein